MGKGALHDILTAISDIGRTFSKTKKKDCFAGMVF
jgi:hypothetical protein